MAILSNPAFGPKTSIGYITAGALLDVWVSVYYYCFHYSGGEHLEGGALFLVLGLFLTGITLVAIGLLLGPIGQMARRSELPPAGYANKEAAIQQTAAANPQPVVAPNSAAPEQMPGQPMGRPLSPVVVTNQAAQPAPASLPTAVKV